MNMRISKSKFVAGCQRLKRLYLQVHQPNLGPDGATDAIIAQGREVGLLARQLFPGGVEVRSEGLDKGFSGNRRSVHPVSRIWSRTGLIFHRSNQGQGTHLSYARFCLAVRGDARLRSHGSVVLS